MSREEAVSLALGQRERALEIVVQAMLDAPPCTGSDGHCHHCAVRLDARAALALPASPAPASLALQAERDALAAQVATLREALAALVRLEDAKDVEPTDEDWNAAYDAARAALGIDPDPSCPGCGGPDRRYCGCSWSQP